MHWQMQAHVYSAIVHEITLVDFKFGDFPQNCQFTKVSHYMVIGERMGILGQSKKSSKRGWGLLG